MLTIPGSEPGERRFHHFSRIPGFPSLSTSGIFNVLTSILQAKRETRVKLRFFFVCLILFVSLLKSAVLPAQQQIDFEAPPPAPGIPVPPLPEGPLYYKTGEGHDIKVVVVARGLAFPYSMVFLPDGTALFSEKNAGALRIIRDGVLDPRPANGIPEVRVDAFSGLLDLELHPDFETNRFLYFTYNKVLEGNGTAVAVARGRWDGRDLQDVEDIYVTNAGIIAGSRLAFGADGHLYVTTFGAFGSVPQQGDTLEGKVLRLTEDGGIPADNPFVGVEGYKPEIFSMGHRSPSGLALHEPSGRIWEVEMGPNGGDEVNVIEAGANYGWPLVSTGRNYAGPYQTEAFNNVEGYVDPVAYWMPSISVSGMAFYYGDKFPKWRNSLFVGGLRTGEIPGTGRLERIQLNAELQEIRRETLLADLRHRVRDVSVSPEGYIYLLTDEEDGAVLRIEPADSEIAKEIEPVADGKVFTGRQCQPQAGTESCIVTAHDAQTGKELWRTRTIALPGEANGDSWGGVAPEDRVHVGTWMVPSYDTELGLVLVGTSVTMPSPKFLLDGNDKQYLYHNSTLALDADTGEIVWHYQHMVDHWDLDHTYERLLVDTAVAPDPDEVKWINPNLKPGEVRKVMTGIPGKTGIVYTLDRETGEFLWARETVRQNVVAGIDGATGEVRLNPAVVFTAKDQSFYTCPSSVGGKNWQAGAYSPRTNAMYMPMFNLCMDAVSTAAPGEWEPSLLYGFQFRNVRPTEGTDQVGAVWAVSAETGELLWKHEQRSGVMSMAATGGGLVFGGDIAGNFRAYNDETGEILWEVNLKAPVSGYPISFSVDSKQYVAVPTGPSLLASYVGNITPEVLQGHEPGGNIYVFALGE